jgi:hypothetical protein
MLVGEGARYFAPFPELKRYNTEKELNVPDVIPTSRKWF